MLGTALYDAWYHNLCCWLSADCGTTCYAGGPCYLPHPPAAGELGALLQSVNELSKCQGLPVRLDPDAECDADLQWVNVAMAKGALVTLLNQTKASLLTQLKGDRAQRGTRRALHYYFVAQDIHGRASSSHVQFQALSRQFRHSDILFRFQRLLTMQAHACRQMAQSIQLRHKYQHNLRFEPAYSRIEDAFARAATAGGNSKLTKALAHLLKKLRAIDAHLANIDSEQAQANGQTEENSLSDDRLIGWSDIRLRIGCHLTPQSAVFSHATRMSVMLCIG